MEIVLRVLQVFLALGLIGVVLLQRSEGGGLGIGSSGGMGSFMSVRGTANFLTRVTAILAGLFMAVCLILALIAKPVTAPKSIFDTQAPATPAAPAPLTQAPAPVTPIETPSAPVAPTPAVTTPVETPTAPVAPAPADLAPPPPPPSATAPAVEAPAPAAEAPAKASKSKKAPKTGAAPKSGQ
jgi:preprotein translocase subunit SecG